MIRLGRHNWENFEDGIRKEWLLTNGLGGFASGTVIGANSRKYHGLLFAALRPPGQRTLFLSQLAEEMTIDGSHYPLYTSQWFSGAQKVVNPKGYLYLESFHLDPFPNWVYNLGDIKLHKTVFMVHGHNATVIRYKLILPPRMLPPQVMPPLMQLGPALVGKDVTLAFASQRQTVEQQKDAGASENRSEGRQQSGLSAVKTPPNNCNQSKAYSRFNQEGTAPGGPSQEYPSREYPGGAAPGDPSRKYPWGAAPGDPSREYPWGPARLDRRPAWRFKIFFLANFRDYHSLTREGPWPFQIQPLAIDQNHLATGADASTGMDTGGNLPGEKIWQKVVFRAWPAAPPLYLGLERGTFSPTGIWWRNMNYSYEEEYRGESHTEDHLEIGYLEIDEKDLFLASPIDGGSPCSGLELSWTIVAATEPPVGFLDPKNGAFLEKEARQRMADLWTKFKQEDKGQRSPEEEDFVRSLVWAADSFIVQRQSTGTKSVIAGYPWFTDWGRDTMIALPGLTLVTGRYEIAREILLTFARYCRDGLLPNLFPDQGEEPLYNTIDASLWYFHAVHQYLVKTGDFDFIWQEIYPVLVWIIRAHLTGTRFNIRVDPEDGLLSGGSRGLQLTWMDAKIGDWVVTPRAGKPVEVNALWYNALRVMEDLTNRALSKAHSGNEIAEGALDYGALAEKVRLSFDKFWYAEGGYLYDVLTEEGPDPSFRPNQIIAVSLPYSPLSPARARQVVEKVWQHLYTTYGLRSLAPGHPSYQGTYGGDRRSRDAAYHQGTVWAWLLGPFVTAFCRVNDRSEVCRRQARRFLEPFREHLHDAGLGTISEIFSGDAPHRAAGCIAQAWSVAEILRAWVEEVEG